MIELGGKNNCISTPNWFCYRCVWLQDTQTAAGVKNCRNVRNTGPSREGLGEQNVYSLSNPARYCILVPHIRENALDQWVGLAIVMRNAKCFVKVNLRCLSWVAER